EHGRPSRPDRRNLAHPRPHQPLPAGCDTARCTLGRRADEGPQRGRAVRPHPQRAADVDQGGRAGAAGRVAEDREGRAGGPRLAPRGPRIIRGGDRDDARPRAGYGKAARVQAAPGGLPGIPGLARVPPSRTDRRGAQGRRAPAGQEDRLRAVGVGREV
ncbi:MAG: hypothetical protein AVDCRST_MAG89-3189, partial [uncultured Gemmatimonadetes bacterium]